MSFLLAIFDQNLTVSDLLAQIIAQTQNSGTPLTILSAGCSQVPPQKIQFPPANFPFPPPSPQFSPPI